MPKGKYSQYALYDPSKPLSSVYKKRAARELKEISEQISAHLESFRRWLDSMPHLKCTKDEMFLLAFLRHAKFNHMKAQRRLDNFCTFRTSPTEGFPGWFEDSAKRRAVLNAVVEMKLWSPLGFIYDGTLVFMSKFNNLNQDEINMSELQYGIQLWNDLSLVDPRIQIGGICMIFDLSNIRKEDVLKIFDRKTSKLSTKYFQECFPLRIRKLIYYNVPKVFETAFKLFSEWLNEKIKSKIMLLGADLSPAFDAVPGLKDIMPESYGGDNKLSFEEICEQQINLVRILPDVSSTFEISVDESKRPKECKGMLGVYKDLPADLMGKSGTFIKLNQDEI